MSGPLTRTIYRRWIALTLRRSRQQAGVSREQAAKERGCSPVRITHLEQARNLPQSDDIAALGRLYELDQSEIDELNALVVKVRDAPPEADLSKLAEVPSGFDTYLGLESGASELDTWDVMVVPGLLQTKEYAQGLLSGHQTGLRTREVGRRVEQRLRRQDVLHRPDQPLQLRAMLDESVLHRCVAGTDVQRAQLRHLVDLGAQPNVSVRVLPTRAPVTAALHGPFMYLTLPIPGDPGLVYLEDRTGGRAIEDPDQIDDYLEVRDALQAGALDESASRELIEQIGEALS